MKHSRRQFLAGSSAASIGMLEWLGYFDRFGVPGTAKDWGIARARAQEDNNERFLIYWFLEGGWDSFSCFSPAHTPNHSALHVPAGELQPQPSWSSQFYRAKNYGVTADYGVPSSVSGIEHGHLAADGRPLFEDMCVLSSLQSSTFHSGSRLDWHYGHYPQGISPRRARDANERSVMQAFAEQRGSGFLLPHVSWHRWLSDGELMLGNTQKVPDIMKSSDQPMRTPSMVARPRK